MNRYKLEEICDFYAGTGFPTMYQGNQEGKYPFYKVGDISKNALAGYSELTLCDNYIDDDVLTKIKGNVLPPHTVVFARIGEALKLNRRGLTTHYCLVDNNVMGISPHQELDYKYFYHFMKTVKMQDYSNATTLPAVKKSEVEKIGINVPSLPEQQKIAAHLDSIQSAIDNKKQQLQQLDELVKSKFVEMFGENNCKQVPFSEYAEIIDGDRGKNYPKSDEFFDDGYCLFLSAKNVTKNGFLFETNQFISEEKDKILRKGKLRRGDIVITTRGTIGNIAYFDETIPYENIRINSGMVIIRGKDLEFNQKFFLEAFRQKIDEIIATQVTGAAQPQLPIHTMSKITLPYPDINLQNTFAEYVQKIDSARLIIKTQLADLQELLDSKMDEYFGE